MAKGQFTPSGVRCFGYAKQDSRGRFQPDTVNSGQAQTEFYEGTQPAVTLSTAGSDKIPGVRHLSGKENYTSVKHLNAKHGGPKVAGVDTSARPEGVRVFKDDSV